MRPVLLLLLVGLAAQLSALGRLVQPDGSTLALGENPWTSGSSLVFPRQAVPARSWLVFPAGTVLSEATLVTAGTRTTLRFPAASAPGLRFAVEVPARLLSLELRGQIPDDLTLVRTPRRPDQAGEGWLVRSPTLVAIGLPGWKTAEGYTSFVTLTHPGSGVWRVVASAGKVQKTFTMAAEVHFWAFAPAAWGFLPERLEVTGADPEVQRLEVRAVGEGSPLPADTATLLAWPPAQWRNPLREWFSWSGSSVLVLITADYRVQDAYLKRLAFFVEKKGYRGRLWSDDEMAALHGWNAHDYAAPDLARFYTEAASQNFPLHAEEVELRDRLTASGILVAQGSGRWAAGTGALVGISAASAPALRSALFTHEAYHGLYFTGPEFQAGVADLWGQLSAGARQAFESYLARSDYDPDFEALMVNEFQAYVLQRPSTEWTGFFRDRVLGGARALGKGPGQPSGQAWLGEYLKAAQGLEHLVGSLYGLESGSVSLVRAD